MVGSELIFERFKINEISPSHILFNQNSQSILPGKSQSQQGSLPWAPTVPDLRGFYHCSLWGLPKPKTNSCPRVLSPSHAPSLKWAISIWKALWSREDRESGFGMTGMWETSLGGAMLREVHKACSLVKGFPALRLGFILLCSTHSAGHVGFHCADLYHNEEKFHVCIM